MRRHLPGLEWVRVRDFLELAELIAGCKLFIGNQSFPYSLAEGLKVPRILELDPADPNVVPTGGLAFDVLFQRQFEHLVDQLAG
jgi:ADP-heptose:LPS heptosyltransferase